MEPGIFPALPALPGLSVVEGRPRVLALLIYNRVGSPMIRVNDEPADYHPGMTVAELLRERGYATAMVAVWIDDEIVPRGAYDTTVVRDGADIKIVLMAAGG